MKATLRTCLSHLSDNDSTKATCHLGQMKALTPEETSRWPDLCLGAWRVNHSSKWRQSKKQALRCLPERICREVLVSCQSSWWAVKSHQGAVISERTAVKTHMVLVEAGGNWIKEILLETLGIVLAITTASSWQMKPQISLKLIFSFSFSCRLSRNSGRQASWRGLCWTVERGEWRKALWMWTDYYISYLNKVKWLQHESVFRGSYSKALFAHGSLIVVENWKDRLENLRPYKLSLKWPETVLRPERSTCFPSHRCYSTAGSKRVGFAPFVQIIRAGESSQPAWEEKDRCLHLKWFFKWSIKGFTENSLLGV